MADVLFDENDPPNYILPTAIADLAEGSLANQQLFGATYPTGRRAVSWHPMVGIATTEPNEGLMTDLLFNLLINFVTHLGGDVSPISPQTSDLVVTDDSQRNGEGFGTTFPFHVRAVVNAAGWQSEGSSVDMAEKIRELLSKEPNATDFQPVRGTVP